MVCCAQRDAASDSEVRRRRRNAERRTLNAESRALDPAAWIISTGTELVLGQSVDTNSAWIATRLAALGVRAQRFTVLPDDAEQLCEVVRDASRRAAFVIISGGLGPTADDLTRAAVARAADVPLEEHAGSLERLREFFAARGRALNDANRVQAMLPAGADALPNPSGTAPGFAIRIGGACCFAVPGVPSEMRAMVMASVEPAIASAAVGRVVRSRLIHTAGLPESAVGQRLADLMARGRNPEVGTTADLASVGVRVNAEARCAPEADAMLDAVEAEVRQRLGAAVWGRDQDTLAGVALDQLRAWGLRCATAESCTGGLISAQLTDVPGSSETFVGGVVTYSNLLKVQLLGVDPELIARRGAVSGEVAQAMARGVVERLGADVALAVTGVAGPGGGSAEKPVGLVYVAVHTPTRQETHELRLGADSSRHAVRVRATRAALNFVRLALAEGRAS